MKRQTAIAILCLVTAACGGRSSGTENTSGSDGTDGTDSTTGTTDGTDGTDTADGTDGTDTTDSGTDGTDGTDSTNGGTDGTDGPGTDVTISEAQQATESTECLEASCMCSYQGGPKACEQAICNLRNNDVLRLKGVVIASPSHYVSAALRGVYIADPNAGGAAYTGVAVTYNSEWTPNFEVGKTYDMDVRLKEAFCNTQFELANLQNLTEVGTATAPAALPVEASAITTPADAEKYEGMKVTLTDLVIASHDQGNTITTDSGVVIDDAFSIWFTGGSWQPPPVGTAINSVTGFVAYSHGAYQVQPPTAADVDLDLPENVKTIEEIQTSEASTNCPPPGCGGNGSFCTIEQNVTIEDAVTTTDIFVVSQSSNLRGFFMSSAGGQNEAIMVVFDHDDLPIGDSTVSEGMTVTVTGTWEEIFCVSQLRLNDGDNLVVGEPATFAGPSTITLDDLALDAGEPWESTLVTVNGPFTVTAVDTGTGIVTLQAPNDALLDISNAFGLWTTGSFPTAGTTYASVTGVVRFYRGQESDPSNYYVSPISESDLPPAE